MRAAAAGRLLTGRCYCGSLVYEVPDDFAYGNYCHCSRCQHQTGAAYTVFVGIRADRIRIVEGADAMRAYRKDPENPGALQFCGRCGTVIYGSFDAGQGLMAHVQLGTFDSPPSTLPGEHIMVGSKAAWEVLPDDGLPRYIGHVHEG